MTDPFQLDKRLIRASFEKAADRYDAVAVLQREVGSRILSRLALFKIAPLRILDVGAGTGWSAEQLAQYYPRAQLQSLDLAHTMLQRARGRFSFLRRKLRGCTLE